MRDLGVQPGTKSSISKFARDLAESFLFASVAATTKRKTRAVSPAGLKLRLQKIETGARRLADQLRCAHGNVFQAWVQSSAPVTEIERQNATQEWLQLRRLLEDSAERARTAAHTLRQDSKVFESRGRPPNDIAHLITIVAAGAYQDLTGMIASRSIDRVSGQPVGPFDQFLTKIFEALDIKSSPDAANMWLQSELAQIGKR